LIAELDPRVELIVEKRDRRRQEEVGATILRVDETGAGKLADMALFEVLDRDWSRRGVGKTPKRLGLELAGSGEPQCLQVHDPWYAILAEALDERRS
jgi:hypothetical protein